MSDTRFYKPPFSIVVSKNTVFELDGCSGFMVENLGATDFVVGEPGQEIIPFASGDSREFEAPEGGIYMGSYSVKFTGGTGSALIVRNSPTGGIANDQKLPENQENYREKLV